MDKRIERLNERWKKRYQKRLNDRRREVYLLDNFLSIHQDRVIYTNLIGSNYIDIVSFRTKVRFFDMYIDIVVS